MPTVTPSAPGSGKLTLAEMQEAELTMSPSGSYSPFSESLPVATASTLGTPKTPGGRRISERLRGAVGFFEEKYMKNRQAEEAKKRSSRARGA